MLRRPAPASPQTKPRAWRRQLRAAIYLLIIVLLAVFLFHLGPDPWVIAASRWPVFLALMISIGAGLVVQARSFQTVAPPGTCRLPMLSLVHIWAVSAVLSIVAPLFAGLATRTALLARSGMPLGACLSTSTRQIWMGLEFALLLAAISLPFVLFPNSYLLAAGAAVGWFTMLAVRQTTGRGVTRNPSPNAHARALLYAIGHPVPRHAYPWYVFQIVLMSLTYYLAFAGLGAPLSWAEAIALSSVTVALSLILFVPNGLGFTDALWVVIATRSGLSLEEAVALAIVIRISHLAVALLLAITTIRSK